MATWLGSGLPRTASGTPTHIQAATAEARGYRHLQGLTSIAAFIAGKLDFEAALHGSHHPHEAAKTQPIEARGTDMTSFPGRSAFDKRALAVACKTQLSKIRTTLFLSFAVGLGGIMMAYLISRLMKVPLGWLTRDPADIAGLGFYVGMLSNLGIMGWTATTTICLTSAVLLKKDEHHRSEMHFMLASGLLSLFLAVDDTFMFHERVFPRVGISEKVIFIGYLILGSGYVGLFFRRILRTDYIVLVLAAIFLGLSAGMDQILPFSNSEAFLEDCPKFLGIVLWSAYFSRTAIALVEERMARSGMPERGASSDESRPSAEP